MKKKLPKKVEIDATKLGTDLANAEAFAKWLEGVLLYVYSGSSAMPYMWNGLHFEPCRKAEDGAFAGAFVKDCVRAVADVEGDEARKAAMKSVLRLQANKAMRDMLTIAKTLPVMNAHMDAFDRNPLLFGVKNGVINLETGQLLASDKMQRVSLRSATAFDQSTQCPRFEQFLIEILPDKEVRNFLQRAVGYTLSGLVIEELLFFLTGSGANGKTVFMDILAKLMGSYAYTLNRSTLTKRRYESDEASRDIVKLQSKRLALTTELSSGDHWNDGAIKSLVQPSKIKARDLYQSAIEFDPTHKLWIGSNAEPKIDDSSNGLIRRVAKINFPNTFSPEQRDPDLAKKLEAELAGILNWALEGFRLYRQEGRLLPPKAVQAATKAYQLDNDSVGQWVNLCTQQKHGSKTSISEAFENYQTFCHRESFADTSQKEFAKRLDNLGIKQGRSAKSRFYQDCEILNARQEFDDLDAQDSATLQ